MTTLPPGSAAIVENVGSSDAARLDFGIPAAADGLDGFLPGRRFAFSTTTTDADPGPGVVAFNNGTLGSVTTLFIDNEGATNSDVTAWLDSFDDSTNTANRGSIFIQHGTDIASFAEFIVTGSVINGTGYRKVPVTPVGGAGAFTNGAPLVLSFTRTGNKGADGLGAGDIVGPAGATDGALALFNGSTGKLLKDGGTVPSPFGQSLLDDPDQATAQTTLGLIIGTNVQAYHASLQSLSSITVSAAALNLLDDPDTAAMLATLGALPRAGGTMMGALTLNGDLSSALHAATKQYVDNVAAGLDVKPSVRLATTTNDTLSGLAARDGVTPVAGNRVLVKNQTSAAANGIYIAASGAWTRAADMDNWLEVPGANVWVEEGTPNGDTAWVCVSNAGVTLGTTAIDWSLYGGTGVYQPASVNLTTWSGTTPAAFATAAQGAKADTAVQPANIREFITANRTYYVRADGSDSNNGLSNVSGGAFLTIQKAWHTILTLDLSGYTVTISIGAGTFSSGLSIISWPVGGNVNVAGAGGTTIISTSGTAISVAAPGGAVAISSLAVTSSGGNGIVASAGATLTIGAGVVFGTCSDTQLRSEGGNITIGGNYSISGGAGAHWVCSQGGKSTATRKRSPCLAPPPSLRPSASLRPLV